MKQLAAIGVILTVLQGCGGGDSSTPAPPPVNPPFSGSLPTNWAITRGSPGTVGTFGGNFNFPQCASAQTCWISYDEVPLVVRLNEAQTYTVQYTIYGDNPVFVHDTKDNTCGGPSSLTLLLRRQGDIDVAPYGRFFSISSFGKPLVLGSDVISVPVITANWQAAQVVMDAGQFSDALLHLGSVGVVFGGGCFAGHGVAVSSGSAAFKIDAAAIQ